MTPISLPLCERHTEHCLTIEISHMSGGVCYKMSVSDWAELTLPRQVSVTIAIKYFSKIRPPGYEFCLATYSR